MKNKTYYIITIGCQMNKSDSERIAGFLESNGYKLADNKYQSDLVVITTCGVRQSAEDRIYGIIPRLKKENSQTKIVITGCLSKREDVKKRLKNKVDYWLPISELSDLGNYLGLDSENISEEYKEDYLKFSPNYSSEFSAFVPIGNGCDNFCTYCVVPYARGREVYRDVLEIINEVKNLVKRGYKEIILIAQNVNSYNSRNTKKQINFSDLLRMVNNIEGDFWIRFATSHPKDMSNELIKTIAECDKICEHVHLPAQSGNNEILQAMNRKYNIEHYKKLIDKIKASIPDVALTTDIIVGFPGETREQFLDTAELFKYVKYDMAYIAQYSSRPGTLAEKLDDNILRKEKKIREEELMKILRKTALENNKKYINKTVQVLVECKNKKGELCGKTRTNKNVKFKSQEENLIGKFVEIKIIKVKDFGLYGEVN